MYIVASTSSKKKKKKFSSSEQKRRHEQLAQEWESLKQRWGASDTKKKSSQIACSNPLTHAPHIRQTTKLNSLNSWNTGPVTIKENKHYTGDAVLGIAVMHKSCLQPVFSAREAEESSKMRRN